jgi:tetratricopeptide (TPR) repeat protein
MGLADDAVGEFLIAARSATKAADARYLIGLVRVDQNRLEDAVQAFSEAIAVPNAGRAQRGAAEYQRGVCFEALGRGPEALRALKSARSLGHDAPDLDRRIRTLTDRYGDVSEESAAALGPGAPAPPGLNGHGPGPSRASQERPPVAGRPKNIDYV